MGNAADIELSQVGTPPYVGGRFAWWVAGVGATCDDPALAGLHYTGPVVYEGVTLDGWGA
jgi:hypothetical protein